MKGTRSLSIFHIYATFIFTMSGVTEEKYPILHAGAVGPNCRHFVLGEGTWGVRWEREEWNTIKERKDRLWWEEKEELLGEERMQMRNR
jgi:hypothetical protein